MGYNIKITKSKILFILKKDHESNSTKKSFYLKLGRVKFTRKRLLPFELSRIKVSEIYQG